jgi:hypothetical protein
MKRVAPYRLATSCMYARISGPGAYSDDQYGLGAKVNW